MGGFLITLEVVKIYFDIMVCCNSLIGRMGDFTKKKPITRMGFYMSNFLLHQLFKQIQNYVGSSSDASFSVDFSSKRVTSNWSILKWSTSTTSNL